HLEHRERPAARELATELPVVVDGAEIAWAAAVITDAGACEIEPLVADRDRTGRLARLLVVGLRPGLGLHLLTQVPHRCHRGPAHLDTRQVVSLIAQRSGPQFVA